VDDRIARLESTAAELRQAVEVLQQRVQLLESGRPTEAPVATAPTAPTAAHSLFGAVGARAGRDPRDPIVMLSLIGRLLLVLAGGFFLRAMTEAGVLAPAVGVSAAFAYAVAWLVMADRASRLQQPVSAVFHALAAALVSFPLLVEATTRFKVLGGASSALVITLLTTAFLFVAWRRRLQPVAWLAVVAALPTAAILLVKTGSVAPFAAYLIAFGVATLWLSYALGWHWLPWPVALGADLAVAGVTLRAVAPEHPVAPYVAMLLQWALLGGYGLSIAIRTLVRGSKVTPFEVTQTAAALLVGFGGEVFLARANGPVTAVIGLVSLLAGIACYGVAYWNIDRHESLERNLYFYTSLGLVFVLAGLVLDVRAQWLGAVFAALGMLAAASWRRFGRPYMLLHAATYVVAAGVVSGAFAYAAWALLAAPEGAWQLPSVVSLLVAVATAVVAWLAAARPSPEGGALAASLRLVVVVSLVWIVGGTLVGLLGPVAVRTADGSVDAGVLATIRTGVLAMGTLFVAWMGGQARYREWAWLLYPLLVGIGLKMVAQDFKDSRPATLFIALALFGVALIVAPRLRRGRPRAESLPGAA